MRVRAVLALLLCFSVPAGAQGLEDRLAALRTAEAAIAAADSNIEQRRALGDAIRAYARAEQDLREDIAGTAGRLRELERALATEEDALRRLLGGLVRAGRVTEPVLLTGASESPADGLRAALLLERAAAAARDRAGALKETRDTLSILREAQGTTLSQMRETHARLAEIRAQLIARAAEDRAATDAIPDIGPDAANLAALAIALENDEPGDPSAVPLEPGMFAWPVDGSLARPFGAADAAGVERPGIAIEAPAAALVTAPAPASVRYVGDLDGYGLVAILEPALGTLVVLAGFETILVAPGELVGAGAPLGFLPAGPGAHEIFLPAGGVDSGHPPAKTLYMELRHDQRPVDPLPWLDEESNKDG